MSEPFLGQISIVAFNFAPRGFASCDGQILPINQNQSLYSLLDTTYGGDGRTTVALLNLEGRAAMHPGRGPDLTSRRLGQRGGVESVTLTEAQMPAHPHTFQADEEDVDVSSPIIHYLVAGNQNYNSRTDTPMANLSLPNAGEALLPHFPRSNGADFTPGHLPGRARADGTTRPVPGSRGS